MNNIYNFHIEESVKDKCWRLSSYILSEYDFQNLTHPWNEYWCIFCNTFKESFENTFIKELIELAGLMRALLDIHSIHIPQNKSISISSIGILQFEENNKEDLNYREACNKLIHSTEFSLDFRESNSHPLFNGKNGYNESACKKFEDPILLTKGIHSRKKWKAEINFFRFIDYTLNLQINEIDRVSQ